MATKSKKSTCDLLRPGSLNKEFELRLAPTRFNTHSANQLNPASPSNEEAREVKFSLDMRHLVSISEDVIIVYYDVANI